MDKINTHNLSGVRNNGNNLDRKFVKLLYCGQIFEVFSEMTRSLQKEGNS